MKKIDKETRKRIFDIIQIGNDHDIPSTCFDYFIVVTILINIGATFLETFDSMAKYMSVIELAICVTSLIFCGEYILRVWTADLLYPRMNPLKARLQFIFSVFGLVDLFSFLPYFVPGLLTSGIVAFRILRVIRIFHLFRINSRYDAFNVVLDVLMEKRQQLFSSISLIIIMMLASSLCMYNLEHEAQPEVFKNAFSGIWWSASTLLTVGYGDIYPVTTMGRVFGIFITFLGVGMVAIPTGIISAGFVEQYQQFKRFGDYGMEQDIRYIQISLTIRDRWVGRSIRSLGLPRGSMVAAVQRGDQLIIPNGDVVLTPGDVLMIAAEQITKGIPMRIQEIILRKNHPWTGSSIRDLDMSRQSYIIMVKREGTARIPDGEMVLQEGDQIYVLSKEKRKRIED